MRRLVWAQRFGASDGLRPLKHERISRILVAVDANDTADGAATLAISLVRRNYNAELAFCHVINTQHMAACVDRSGDDYGLSFELAREAALAVLERCCLFARNAGLFARSYVRFGSPVSETQSFARGRGAELIVIGNRPAEKAHRLLEGSVRDEMVRTCPYPFSSHRKPRVRKPISTRAASSSPERIHRERAARSGSPPTIYRS